MNVVVLWRQMAVIFSQTLTHNNEIVVQTIIRECVTLLGASHGLRDDVMLEPVHRLVARHVQTHPAVNWRHQRLRRQTRIVRVIHMLPVAAFKFRQMKSVDGNRISVSIHDKGNSASESEMMDEWSEQ